MASQDTVQYLPKPEYIFVGRFTTPKSLVKQEPSSKEEKERKTPTDFAVLVQNIVRQTSRHDRAPSSSFYNLNNHTLGFH